MAAALGVKFKDEQDQKFIPTGGTLSKIYKIDMNNIYPKIKDIEFIRIVLVKIFTCKKSSTRVHF